MTIAVLVSLWLTKTIETLGVSSETARQALVAALRSASVDEPVFRHDSVRSD